MCISFHPLTPADKSLVQERVYHTECRNCDLNFMNLVSWRFMYDTEVALHRDFLLFRFKADGHLAYLAPVGTGNWKAVLHDMMADAAQLEHPFLMLGVCENALAQLDVTMPGYFYATADRAFTDYIYSREKLASLAGKKLQPKRNYVNRFTKLYPDFTTEPLTSKDIDECIALDAQWVDTKAAENEAGRYTFDAERQSLITALKHWDVLEGRGMVLRVNGKIVAFTYGAPINYDTFGVCVEKADTAYEGAFATINREFVRSLPPQFTLINREEDLGIEGLRRSKLSYQPEFLLSKYTVMTKHPFSKS